MELSTAIELIKGGVSNSDLSQRWADLGAGEGLFTRALASVLPNDSSILAIDQNAGLLKSVDLNFKSASLQTHKGDFTELNWGENFDGILMANALHYVKDQINFLHALKAKLVASGRLIVVEYENRQANAWVPYPIDFIKLKEVGYRSGFSSIGRLEDAPSIYGGGKIYSALLTS